MIYVTLISVPDKRYHRIAVVHSLTDLRRDMNAELFEPLLYRLFPRKKHLVAAKAEIHVLNALVFVKVYKHTEAFG